jgi:hypothetical protein
MSLNQKAEFKNKVSDSNYHEINLIFLSGNQNSDPPLMKIYFSLQYGVARSLLAKFHQNPKFQVFPVNFLMNFNS